MGSQKEVEALKEDRHWHGKVCNTEDGLSSSKEVKFPVERDSVRDISVRDISVTDISVEAASLLLAMKLLNLVPPDFCLRPPPSPQPPPSFLNLPSADQSSLPPDPESRVSPSSNRSIYPFSYTLPDLCHLFLRAIPFPSPPTSLPSSSHSTIHISLSFRSSDANPLPLALKLLNVIPSSFSYLDTKFSYDTK